MKTPGITQTQSDKEIWIAPDHLRIDVDPSMAGKRLDALIASQTDRLSRSRIQSLIESGDVRVNGAKSKPSSRVRQGDIIDLIMPATVPVDLLPEEISIPLIYEDDDLLVLNKPAGLVVHPGAGIRSGTVVNALLFHCKTLSGIGGEARPGVVHRLDKETSGCLVVAKHDAAHIRLSRQFSSREVRKYYLALCRGVFRTQSGDITESIGRHPVQRQKMSITPRGRTARTHYQTVQQLSAGTLVLCRLYTGRTHQIRVHLQHLGNPILGDKIYGRAIHGFQRQMLHAWRLGFFHPVNEKWLEFEAELPNDFGEIGIDPNALLHARSQLDHSPPSRTAASDSDDHRHPRTD